MSKNFKKTFFLFLLLLLFFPYNVFASTVYKIQYQEITIFLIVLFVLIILKIGNILFIRMCLVLSVLVGMF